MLQRLIDRPRQLDLSIKRIIFEDPIILALFNFEDQPIFSLDLESNDFNQPNFSKTADMQSVCLGEATYSIYVYLCVCHDSYFRGFHMQVRLL